MGLFISRFKKKLSTKEVLEEIEVKLKTIEEFKQDTQERQKRVTRRLLTFTFVTYLASFLAFFFVDKIRKQSLIFAIGVVSFAFFVWAFRKLLRWHYTRQIQLNDEIFSELKKRKQKILEEVMDKETYKVAKEILDKYGDKAPLKPPPTPAVQRPQAPGTELRRRNPESQVTTPRPPMPQQTPHHQQQAVQHIQTVRRDGRMASQPMSRALPRPVLPRDRGVMDRILDYLVGDGPNQRFALICRYCGGHNGMSLQEEFDYIGYRCCYCFQWNPPRKQRLAGPRLPQPAPLQPANPSEGSTVAKEKVEDETLSGGNKSAESSEASIRDGQEDAKSDQTLEDSGKQSTAEQSDKLETHEQSESSEDETENLK